MATQGFIGTLARRDDEPIRLMTAYRDRLAREMEALEAELARARSAIQVAIRVAQGEVAGITPTMSAVVAILRAALAPGAEARDAERERLNSLAAGYQTAEREDWTGATE